MSVRIARASATSAVGAAEEPRPTPETPPNAERSEANASPGTGPLYGTPSIAASSMRASSRSAAVTPSGSASSSPESTTRASAARWFWVALAARLVLANCSNARACSSACAEPPPKASARGAPAGAVVALVVAVVRSSAADALADGALDVLVVVIEGDRRGRIAAREVKAPRVVLARRDGGGEHLILHVVVLDVMVIPAEAAFDDAARARVRVGEPGGGGDVVVVDVVVVDGGGALGGEVLTPPSAATGGEPGLAPLAARSAASFASMRAFCQLPSKNASTARSRSHL